MSIETNLNEMRELLLAGARAKDAKLLETGALYSDPVKRSHHVAVEFEIDGDYYVFDLRAIANVLEPM